MKKVLILGDYENFPYHGFHGVDKELVSILGDGYSANCTDDYDELLNIENYELFISYTDCWKNTSLVTDEQIASLVSFVAKGGSALILHSGISLQTKKEFVQLVGGKFTNHPAMENLIVEILDKESPITKGVEDFVTFEEPYRFEIDPISDVKILTQYKHEGIIYPNSWEKTFCKGKVVFLMNGHTKEHFKEISNRKLIKNSADYLTCK